MPAMPKTSKVKPSQAVPRSKSQRVEIQRFEGRLERLRSRLNWIVVYVPFDATGVWGLRGQIKVKGEINGFGFRTSLFPTKEGGHFLLVNKKMQKAARAFEGNTARFQMQLDVEERTVTIPAEIKGLLSEDRALRRWYDQLNHSTRADMAKWITEPKSSQARVRRAEQLAERLLSVMEAEQELPPILQVVFARNPRARDGWDSMSRSRRRGHLFAIFYYRTPEAQGRRIEKVLDDATAMAEKKRNQEK